jgi:hypothetical protein
MRWYDLPVAVVVLAVSGLPGCYIHPSKSAPAEWGMTTIYGSPVVLELSASGGLVREAIDETITEMGLEIRRSDKTGVDGQYIVRSALQQKLRISFQAVSDAHTRVEVYRNTVDETLQNLVAEAIRSRVESQSRAGHSGSRANSTPTNSAPVMYMDR